MTNIDKYNENVFESIKHIDEVGNEFWYARDLMKVLDYNKWQNFHKVIKDVIIACNNGGNTASDWLTEVSKPKISGKGRVINVTDYKLSRYACYLIVQNGDPRKETVALGQTYFAYQTRKQELFEEISEDEKRIMIRRKVKDGNLGLNQTAVKCGVKDLAKFTNAGYKGLYNGETADDIFRRKKLRYREDILDNMGSSELITNLFRIDQTDAKLKRDKVDNEHKACDTHYEIGKKVRKAIADMNGTMPEDLSTPKKSLKELVIKK